MDPLTNTSEEYTILRDSVRAFVRSRVEPQAIDFNRREAFNAEIFKELGALGLLGVTVREEFGGSGLDATAAVIIHEELSWSDPGLALAYLAHAMLCTNNIAVNANDEQRRTVLPKLCTGEWIGAMAMSEPGAGTDVLAMNTTAKAVDDGFVINGRKMWITNGSIDSLGTPCDVLLLYARTGTDAKGRAEISTFLLERAVHTYRVGQVIKGKLGMRASMTAELCFDDCRVPAAALIGGVGESLKHMMRNLELERVTLAAMALGIARRCIETMVEYAEQRKAFGKKIIEFGQIQSHIALSYAEYSAARAYVYAVASRLSSAVDAENHRVDSDAVKLIAAPMAKRVADRAIQVLGGNGYIEEYSVERLWRDAKLLEIGGGTLESHEKNIAKDLGAVFRAGGRL